MPGRPHETSNSSLSIYVPSISHVLLFPQYDHGHYGQPEYHQRPGPVAGERIQRAVDIFKVTFPIGVDGDWTNLKRWWLDRDASNWTSVSFLLDREGKIAHIHPGGDYYLDPENPKNKSHQDYLKLVEAIEKSL